MVPGQQDGVHCDTGGVRETAPTRLPPVARMHAEGREGEAPLPTVDGPVPGTRRFLTLASQAQGRHGPVYAGAAGPGKHPHPHTQEAGAVAVYGGLIHVPRHCTADPACGTFPTNSYCRYYGVNGGCLSCVSRGAACTMVRLRRRQRICHAPARCLLADAAAP